MFQRYYADEFAVHRILMFSPSFLFVKTIEILCTWVDCSLFDLGQIELFSDLVEMPGSHFFSA